jgi:2-dehydro-3-deoxyphosphogluconate aldolase/(4S)-4-hydroxy-2-oxoglutarate aldolase
MKKEDVRKQVIDSGLIPVLRLSSPALAIEAAEAVCDGGITFLEITMTVPGAVDVIRKLVDSLGKKVVVGAGTVLDSKQAQQCLDAGAEFLVSPAFDAGMVEVANHHEKLVMAGALTPTEVVRAWNAGADFVKVFPCGNVGGPSYIKALKGPLPNIPLIPTGGVTLSTAAAFIAAGASALGVGGDLISEAELKAGNRAHVTNTARQFVSAVRDARQGLRSA